MNILALGTSHLYVTIPAPRKQRKHKYRQMIRKNAGSQVPLQSVKTRSSQPSSALVHALLEAHSVFVSSRVISTQRRLLFWVLLTATSWRSIGSCLCEWNLLQIARVWRISPPPNGLMKDEGSLLGCLVASSFNFWKYYQYKDANQILIM